MNTTNMTNTTTMAGFTRGMGIGGWLTNYKRFNVLPQHRRMTLTMGDFEHFQTYITREDVRYIASLGMDHIRLGFDQIVLEEAPGCYRQEMMELLSRFVDWCEEFGLNVVLNLHKAVGNYCDIAEDVHLLDDAGLQDRFIALWMRLEEYFADRPQVAFELLNEVTQSPDKWNDLAERAVRELHDVNPERLLIIGSAYWNSSLALKQLRVYEDDRVAYTFHMYEPAGFTHQQGVLQAAPLYYNRKMPWPGDIERYRDFERVVYGAQNPLPGYTEMGRQFIFDKIQPALDFLAVHPGKALWCGEFGTIRHIPIQYRENYMRDVISFLVQHGIPYCVWNYLSNPNDGNRFSLVDDDTRRILSDEMARIIRGDVGD